MADIEILRHCGPFLSRYKALICDIWGVLHDGVEVFPEVNAALQAFRAQNGTVVLLTNSPQMSFQIEDLLDEKNVSRHAYDGLVTSGDLTVAALKSLHIKTAYHIGPARHFPIYDAAKVDQVALENAQCMVCTGFFIEPYDDLAKYQDILEQALPRGLKMICANPDLVVDVGGELIPCAGALAARYEQMGGHVHWAGKPHVTAYETALAKIEQLSGPVAKKDVLVIGDALRTDIAGAHNIGCDALFVGRGIHRHEVCDKNHVNAARLKDLFEASNSTARAAVFTLQW